MAKKKQRKFNQDSAIRGALRRVFARSPVIWDVLRAHRQEHARTRKDGSRCKKDAVLYPCMACKNLVSRKDVAVDHIDPVVSSNTGFVDYDTFIKRLFCDASNLQLLCSTCHQEKTNRERAARKLASQK